MRRIIFTIFFVLISLQGYCQVSNRPLDEMLVTLNAGYHTGAGEYSSYEETEHATFDGGAIFSAELTGRLDNVYCGLEAMYWNHSQSISINQTRKTRYFGVSLQIYYKHNLGLLDLYAGGGPGVCTINEDNVRYSGEDSFLYLTLKARGGADINISKVLALNIDASVTGLSLLLDNKLTFSIKAGPKIRLF